MSGRGWLLDSYIVGRDAHLWIKTVEGEALHLTERHRPHFVAQPSEGIDVDDLCLLMEEHKLVHSARPVERYTDLGMMRTERVAEVRADSASCLNKVVAYARSTREVREVFDVGLSPVQWYLIERGVAPTGLCEYNAEGSTLKRISSINDDGLAPPPFKVLILMFPEDASIKSVDVLDQGGDPLKRLEGDEYMVLSDLKNFLQAQNPDVVVSTTPRQ